MLYKFYLNKEFTLKIKKRKREILYQEVNNSTQYYHCFASGYRECINMMAREKTFRECFKSYFFISTIYLADLMMNEKM